MLVKVTDKNLRTYNGFQWEIGIWKEASGIYKAPCTNGVLHYYNHEILASLFRTDGERFWEVEIENPLGSDRLKSWCTRQRIVKEIQVPEFSNIQVCALMICLAYPAFPDKWKNWADNWLSGRERMILPEKSKQKILGIGWVKTAVMGLGSEHCCTALSFLIQDLPQIKESDIIETAQKVLIDERFK